MAISDSYTLWYYTVQSSSSSPDGNQITIIFVAFSLQLCTISEVSCIFARPRCPNLRCQSRIECGVSFLWFIAGNAYVRGDTSMIIMFSSKRNISMPFLFTTKFLSIMSSSPLPKSFRGPKMLFIPQSGRYCTSVAHCNVLWPWPSDFVMPLAVLTETRFVDVLYVPLLNSLIELAMCHHSSNFILQSGNISGSLSDSQLLTYT
jgi:hypothetical protein